MLIFDCLRTIIIVYFCNRNMITLDEHIEEVFYAMVEARLKRVRRMSLAEAREESLQLLMEACYANSGTRRLYEMVAAALEEVERCDGEGCEEEPRSSWEESIPEYLRTGKLGEAWNELRDNGVLREDYQLKERKAAGRPRRSSQMPMPVITAILSSGANMWGSPWRARKVITLK